MPDCLINNEPSTPLPGRETWGDWLADLDTALAHDRRIVTAARFDGVDEPSFRTAPVAAWPLGGFGRIEVETADTLALLAETLDMARDSLPVLATNARQAAQT